LENALVVLRGPLFQDKRLRRIFTASRVDHPAVILPLTSCIKFYFKKNQAYKKFILALSSRVKLHKIQFHFAESIRVTVQLTAETAAIAEIRKIVCEFPQRSPRTLRCR
jgi:hypothetical protein